MALAITWDGGTGVSEIYGSRRRLPSLTSFLIESFGQLFGFHIGGGAGFRSGELVIQLLASSPHVGIRHMRPPPGLSSSGWIGLLSTMHLQ